VVPWGCWRACYERPYFDGFERTVSTMCSACCPRSTRDNSSIMFTLSRLRAASSHLVSSPGREQAFVHSHAAVVEWALKNVAQMFLDLQTRGDN
jgi:hypothetical protein